jgi:hypothetical protein
MIDGTMIAAEIETAGEVRARYRRNLLGEYLHIYLETYPKERPSASRGNSAILIAKKAAMKESGSCSYVVRCYRLLLATESHSRKRL